MAVPIVETRINFDGLGLNRVYSVGNDSTDAGFEVGTTGWSVAAGIQGAATSITRNTSSPYQGTAAGRLVTTATNGSGVKYVMATTFTSGVTYRFRVFLRSISGNTSLGIRLGSLGTAGDRAVTTFTVTGTWTAYSVDMTPTGNRSDLQVNVYMNTGAAIATVDIDAAEVYAVRDDLLADSFSFVHGANFEGGLLTGTGTLHLTNMAAQYTSGATLITAGMLFFARATHAGIPYGLFYGAVERVAANVADRTVDVFINDPVDSWGKDVEISDPAVEDTVSNRRLAALGLAIYNTGTGTPAYATAALTTFEDEANIIWHGMDQTHLPEVLAALDVATGTVGYLAYSPAPEVGFVYTTIARNARSIAASAETINDVDFIDVGWELNDQDFITDQRVTFTGFLADPDHPGNDDEIATYPNAPFTVIASSTRAAWMSSGNPVINAGFNADETGGSGSDSAAWYWRTGVYNAIAGGADETVNSIAVTGRQLLPQTDSVTFAKGAVTTLRRVGPDISTEAIATAGAAYGLADWTVNHIPTPTPRITITRQNVFPSQVARKLCDKLTLTVARVNAASYLVLIRTISTTIDMAALQWTTTFECEPAGIPLTGSAFIINSSTLTTGGSSSQLGY